MGKLIRPTPDVLPSLPTSRWPDTVPLDPAMVRAALWRAKGNLVLAAHLLGTSQARLGVLLKHDPALAEERTKAAELLLDQAEHVLVEALEDPDQQTDTAKWILSNAGRVRGYGKDAPTPLGISFGGAREGTVAIRWDIK